MILFFYNVALLIGLAAASPWWLWRMATTQKYREGLSARLGRVPARLTALRGQRPLVWIHAVSVGEVLSAARLVKTLDSELPGHCIVVSTTTRTGQTLARERFGAERVFYCPLDLPWAVHAYLRALRPSLLVLIETEFWPNLLSACARRHVPVAVVNARLSDRSWPRYRLLRGLWRPFLSRMDAVLAQSELDAERLRALGCRAERVSVAGNLKFDVRAAAEAPATRILKTLADRLRVVVAGSTLEGEEPALLAAWPQVLAAQPEVVMVLAPRHPERFSAVASLVAGSGFPWVRRSAWNEQAEGGLTPLVPGQIVLLDTIGELASVYSLAAVAFVGGSLVPTGGHNLLEPAQFGVAIVAGPHDANFRAIAEALRAHDALRVVRADELAAALAALLGDPGEAAAMGARAQEVFHEQAGATERCVAALQALLDKGRP